MTGCVPDHPYLSKDGDVLQVFLRSGVMCGTVTSDQKKITVVYHKATKKKKQVSGPKTGRVAVIHFAEALASFQIPLVLVP